MLLEEANTKNLNAFSIIELMIVIAIIGILAAVAFPAYEKYITRSKIATSMGLVNNVRNKISEHFYTTGSFPTRAQLASYFDKSLRIGYYMDFNASNLHYVALEASLNILKVGLDFDVQNSEREFFLRVYKDANNQLTWYCGIWRANGDTSTAIRISDTSFMPDGCNYQRVCCGDVSK